MGKIEITMGDITTERVDVIVNAANESLLGGGGVDGAIHRAAGSELLVACRGIGGCPTGEARLTEGFQLAARYVIHTVGPIWRGGGRGEPELLAGCYRNSFSIIGERSFTSVAFPAISTGAYRFPVKLAADIAIAETRKAMARFPALAVVRFVCFNPEHLAIYRAALGN